MVNMNFKEFEELINSGIKEIILYEDVILENDEKEMSKHIIEIDSDELVIDGNNHIIDFNNVDGYIKSLNFLILKNIIFKNYKKGLSLILNYGDLIIDNCRFIKNKCIITNKSNIWIKNSCFKHNEDNCIYNYKDSSLFISDSLFSKNHARFSNVVLIDNKGFCEIVNSKFQYNKNYNSDICVIYNENALLNIDGCEFKNNKNKFCTHDYDAYVNSILNKNGEVNLKNSVFESENYSFGKSIQNTGIFNIYGCVFNKSEIFNLKYWLSTDVNNKSYMEIEKSTFQDDGEIIGNNGFCKIKSCNINEGTIINTGSLLMNAADFDKHDETFEIWGIDHICKFTSSNINEKINRGYLLMNASDFDEIDEITMEIINNFSIKLEESQFGNILIIVEYDDLSLKDLLNSNEDKISLKSDIFIPESDYYKKNYPIELKRDNVIIDGNNHTIYANYQNILKITGNNIILKNINFKNGFSNENGIILNLGDNLKLINCTFENLHANACGVIHNDSKFINIENCEFKDNFSGLIGGVIFNEKESIINILSSDFKDDDAKIVNKGKFNICNSNLNNKSIINDGKLSISNCKFANQDNIKNNNLFYLTHNGKKEIFDENENQSDEDSSKNDDEFDFGILLR